MPQGKGTYGSKVGRPPAKHIIADKDKASSGWRHEGHEAHNSRHKYNPNFEHGTSKEKFDYKGDAKSPTKQLISKKQKDHYKGENTEKNKLKNLSDEQQSHLDNLNKRRKTANTENEYLKFNKKYTTAVDSIHNVINPTKPASPLEYAPFKMKAANYGNSPMRKNFGIGDSEMAIKTAPVKFGGVRGIMDKLRGGKGGQMPQSASMSDMMRKLTGGTQPPQSAAMGDMAAKVGAGGGIGGGVMDPMGMGGGMGAVDTSNSFAPQAEQQAGGGEGGAVPPHGPEAHTGGAAPIGGAQKKRGLGNFLFGGGGGRGR